MLPLFKPRSHFPGSRPRMWSWVIRDDPGVILGSSLAHPGSVRCGPGWSGLILGRSGLGRGCIKMFNTTSSRLRIDSQMSHPGLVRDSNRVVRDSSGTRPGLVRDSSVEWWSQTSYGLAPNEPRTTPGWLPDDSRMCPGIPGRVTDDPQMNTD